MNSNIEQFSLYTAKIFDVLYESFPVPTDISKSEIITEYLSFNKDKQIKEYQLKRHIVDMAGLSDDAELKKKSDKALPEISSTLSLLESEKTEDRDKQENIYQGTLDFLISENLIKEHDSGRFQLTSKSFSHLNKIFEGGNIKNEDTSFISAIKILFSKSSSTSIDIAAGTAINIVTKILGFS